MYKFFEVFKTLRLPEELGSYLADTEVTRVSKTSTNTLARVYLKSDRLIGKPVIYKTEDALKKQVFRMKNMDVRIIDRYHLSKQYTPVTIMEVYYDSILFELEKYWTLEYNLLKNSSWEFEEEDRLVLELEDSFLARTYADSLADYFHKVFLNRFGFEIDVVYRYKTKNGSHYQKENEHKLNLRVKQIQQKMEAATGSPAAAAAAVLEKKSGAENKKKAAGKEAATQTAAKAAGPIQGKSFGGQENRSFSRNDKFYKKPSNDDVLYGRDFDEEPMPIEQIDTALGEVVISGMIRKVEEREIRNERTIMMFDITDFTDTITVKIFVRNEQLPEMREFIKKKNFIKVKGIAALDRYDQEISIANVSGIRKSYDNREVRNDLALNKRVELHCHTKMSDMDGVSSVSDIMRQAIRWGHKALAITDHGVVQAFTEAYHTLKDIQGDYKKKGEKLDFKLIYGVEAYLVDDTKQIVTNPKGQQFTDTYVVFDLETTGFSAEADRIIEIGAVKITDGKIVDKFSTFVNPQIPISFRIEKLTGITDAMVLSAPTIETVLKEFLDFCGDAVLVAHNAEFDTSFIANKAQKQGITVNNTILDTVLLAQFVIPNLHNYKLDTLCKHLGVSLENHHRAVDDAGATADAFIKLIEMLKERDIFDLEMLNEKGKLDVDSIRKLHQYHCIILAANETGRINLYRLISASHLTYFSRFPKIPKSLVNQYRDGLIVGSACEAGELFRAMLSGRSDAEIARIVNFYDYLEVQPIGNNHFMIEKEDCYVQNEEDLRDLNRRVVALGSKFHKPVVATCDVHFLNPEDEIYRRIIMAGKGFDDADNQAPLYLHTTEEMLHEFDYLGSEKAYEIVVENTNKIMNLCEEISPVRPDKCPPVIENSDEMLRKICHDRAHEIYGPKLPQIVTERLDRELNSIISNGYSVMYIIAQKLVWKSNDDGYLVGSRGSVGSSFAATMAGITEVNPLSPHYLCPKCFYNEFYSEDVKKFAGGAGCDMPDKICPNCGHKLNKLGFDIPFETFLGFKGDKEPDIDLNFSGVYQPVIHKYTETFFGKGKVFKAGTIGTVAEKTAFGYVKKYCEERNLVMRNAEMKRLAKGCEGVKRTSGQHPGGIIVVPFENDIHEFCPVQHPADDPNSDIITTHFDYHKIDQNLLKLDELGHDDPTVIRMLEDITGLHARDIPIGDPETMSLFTSNKALKLLPGKDIGTNLGTYGIPEFGTKFVRQMLEDTKPTTFSELVRISGLSHGTDVWLGNAQELIREGKCDLSHSICARDDIMIYLISCGVEEEHSFKIMEMVRKGKGLTPEYEQEMRDNNVPDWYIESCKKIKYMFPKAHAAAYVMSAFRIAYFKVHYPEAFYIAYYTVRADDFDASVMARGEERVREEMRSINAKKKDGTVTPKEENLIPILEICIEMYARGINFVPVDLYESHATDFRQVEGGILPPLSALPGLSENDAISITEERKNGEFRNVEDLRIRTGIGKNPLNILEENGCFDDLPDTDQVSLFD